MYFRHDHDAATCYTLVTACSFVLRLPPLREVTQKMGPLERDIVEPERFVAECKLQRLSHHNRLSPSRDSWRQLF